MGICTSDPLPGGAEQQEAKPEDIKPLIDQPLNEYQKDENEAAVKIQTGLRGKKAKLELQKKKEELEQDKPKEWNEYKEKFEEPQLPKIFKEKVNYKPTNEDRILPPYLGPDGSVYNGQWNKGEVNGYGQMLKPDGTYLKGLWKSNILQEGGILYPNGDFYIGTSKYGQRYFANGVIYKGETDFGMPHGQGEETNPDGSKSEAFYQYGQKVQQEHDHQNH
ncbi:unnamed protein product [Paramecium pentaurelia]|uniref:MORN repeat protein n=1 Tax=Paramecium pentaurelia TaxID=43138 RepID=A0A8S1UZF8_9CILI|nr:unnamed protein product [Paramecium pentaurelia]